MRVRLTALRGQAPIAFFRRLEVISWTATASHPHYFLTHLRLWGVGRPIIHRRTNPGGSGVKLLSCHYSSGCYQTVGESLACSTLALKEILQRVGKSQPFIARCTVMST